MYETLPHAHAATHERGGGGQANIDHMNVPDVGLARVIETAQHREQGCALHLREQVRVERVVMARIGFVVAVRVTSGFPSSFSSPHGIQDRHYHQASGIRRP